KAKKDLLSKLLDFKNIIESKGITINGNNLQDLSKNIKNYFKFKGYIFKPGLVPNGNGTLALNLALYKKISSRNESLDNFTLLGTIDKEVPINDVQTIIGSYENSKGFINDGLTIQGTDGSNQILIFPKELKQLAKMQNISDIDGYRESVEINELSQVYFSNFIDNRFLGVKLKDFVEVPNPNWTIHSVLEAYSDYETIKQGDFSETEIDRIRNSKANKYSFSKAIINATIDERNNSGDKTPLKELILEQYELNIKNIIGSFNGYLDYINKQN
ncbi:MAG: hypothetical protein Q9M94_05380, partial [Candidatus Gracilibacteria bacterium]|nr:hypothetical protein [Candidatus Gracilibacteria bacterium]